MGGFNDTLYTSSSHTGSDAIAPRKESQVIKEAKETAELVKITLQPVIEVLREIAEEETANAADLRSYLNTFQGRRPTTDEIQDEYRGREIYLTYLARHEKKVIEKLSERLKK